MTSTWILVANAAVATVYCNEGPKKGLARVKTLEHAASREKGADLSSDRPGHNQSSGNRHGAFVPAKMPKEVEAERFALEIARVLDHGRTQNAYQRLILVASPHFMGLIKQHLEGHVRQLVSESIEKDYTKLNERELAPHLEHCIYL
ncbi:MAG: host attachment protein [Burkholderiales bacterium]|nr:host attachment protein [Burkholderiales bacterium]